MKLKLLMKAVSAALNQNISSICTGLVISGVLAEAYSIGKATVKATKQITFMEESVENFDKDPKEFRKEKIKAVAPLYIPSALIMMTTIGCVIFSNAENLKRQAALATAYSLSELSYKELDNKVKETIGEKKTEKIKEEIAKEKAEKNQQEESIVYETGYGNTLCYEPLFGRYFRCDKEKLREVKNSINEEMLELSDPRSIADFYESLNLDGGTIGTDLQWQPGYNGIIEFELNEWKDRNGEPALVIHWTNPPKILPYGALEY